MTTEPDLDTHAATTDVAALSQSLAQASQQSALLARSLTAAFDQIVIKGKSASEAFNSIALAMAQSALKSAFQPLQQNVLQGIGNLFGGGAPFPFARGGVLQSGTPIPFAQGGVIASPLSFPLAGGRAGLAGERGAEAIMPLARGPDGRLGVAASGTAAPSILVNITATDVESFRRSEAQVSALLSRAVAHGQRNL